MLSSTLRKVRANRLRAAAFIVVCSIAAIGVWDLFTGVHHLSAYDSDWDDLDDFRTSLEERHYKTTSIVSTPVILNISEGVYPDGRVLVVIGVERPYLPDEISNIVDFVANGGCLLLADDFGYGNALATKFGLGFSGRKLYSASFDRNPAFVKLNASLANVPYNVITDRPCALEKVSDHEVVAWTYKDTWMDENSNGERDFEEESNPYPVVAARNWKNGYVVIVSDPGIFIDDMWGRGQNTDFMMECLFRNFRLVMDTEFTFDETRHKPGTLREGAWRTAMMLEVLALNNIIGKGALAILALAAVIAGAIMVKPPAEWRHEDTLSQLSLHHLAERRFRAEDRVRLRAVFLEKVRISLSMYRDEFDHLDRDSLREVIADDRLWGLVVSPSSVKVPEMEELTDLAREWRKR
jgi:hypothetical protein